MRQKGFTPILILLVVGLGLLAYFSFFYKSPSPSLVQETTPPVPTQTSSATSDPTTNWKTYMVSAVGLSFKLPPEITSQVGELKESILPGEKGTMLSFSSKSPIFTLGTTSVDYEEGRGGMFSDLQGFIKSNGTYSARFVQGKSFSIPSTLVKEIKNNNIEIIRILGQDHTTGEYLGPIEGTPGEGMIGALLNIPSNEKYTGLTVQMKLGDDFTTALFDQILSTFQFTQ